MAKPQYYTPEDEITFNIIDENTVEQLQREGDINLPRRRVDVSKDERWNTKLMSSRLLEGILGGYSVPTIANSINQVINSNVASATRNARTMVTGAENVGRYNSYQNLADQGVIQKKIWMATADDRTRDSHLDLDGQERDIDKAFSNGLMYPGDPKGEPSEVWNCRCSMRDKIVGFRSADGTISRVDYDRDETIHEQQMNAERERRQNNEDKSPVFNAEEWLRSLDENSETEFLDMYNDWVKGLSKDEKNAIHTYTTGAYNRINGYLRGYNDVNMYPREIERATNALSRANLPRTIVVRRGSDEDSLKGLLGGESIPYSRNITQEWLDKLTGRVITDEGFLSTSPISGGGFTDSINYIIQIPQGANAMYVAPLSEFRHEKELLINRKSTYIIEKVEKDGGGGLQVFMRLLL